MRGHTPTDICSIRPEHYIAPCMFRCYILATGSSLVSPSTEIRFMQDNVHTRKCVVYLQSVLEAIIQLHYSSLVATAITIVRGSEECHHITLTTPVVTLQEKIVIVATNYTYTRSLHSNIMTMSDAGKLKTTTVSSFTDTAHAP